MLQKLKGEPGPAALARSPSPLPMKMDGESYEEELYEEIYSVDMSSEGASVSRKELPPPPDRLVPGERKFPHKADPFRKKPLCQKPAEESNLGKSLFALPCHWNNVQFNCVSLSELLLEESATMTSERM